MRSKEVFVQNSVGLHARPAAYFVKKANEFESLVWIQKGNRKVSAKSLLGVLSLGVVGGNSFTIIVNGVDEKQALSDLVDLIENGFKA